MNDQYFTREPTSASNRASCAYTYRGHTLRCETDSGVFSRGELDAGTRLLLDALPKNLTGDVLDLGCGWGAAGVAVAKANPECRVTSTDVNLRALELTRENARLNGVTLECLESDGLSAVAGRHFRTIFTNPPIRAGKETVCRLFREASEALLPGGELYVVIRKQQGGDSAMKYLAALLDSVEKVARSGGFWVIRCVKAA